MKTRKNLTKLSLAGTTLALSLTLAACAPETPKTSDTNTNTSTAKPETENKPATEKQAETTWTRVNAPGTPFSFELPENWQTTPLTGETTGIEIRDHNGATKLTLHTNITGLGGACTEEMPLLTPEILDSTPVNLTGYTPADMYAQENLKKPEFQYRVSKTPNGYTTSLSIADDTPTQYCFYYNLMHDQNGLYSLADTLQVDAVNSSARTFPDLEAAKQYMQTDEYKTLKHIITTLQQN